MIIAGSGKSYPFPIVYGACVSTWSQFTYSEASLTAQLVAMDNLKEEDDVDVWYIPTSHSFDVPIVKMPPGLSPFHPLSLNAWNIIHASVRWMFTIPAFRLQSDKIQLMLLQKSWRAMLILGLARFQVPMQLQAILEIKIWYLELMIVAKQSNGVLELPLTEFWPFDFDFLSQKDCLYLRRIKIGMKNLKYFFKSYAQLNANDLECAYLRALCLFSPDEIEDYVEDSSPESSLTLDSGISPGYDHVDSLKEILHMYYDRLHSSLWNSQPSRRVIALKLLSEKLLMFYESLIDIVFFKLYSVQSDIYTQLPEILKQERHQASANYK